MGVPCFANLESERPGGQKIAVLRPYGGWEFPVLPIWSRGGLAARIAVLAPLPVGFSVTPLLFLSRFGYQHQASEATQGLMRQNTFAPDS